MNLRVSLPKNVTTLQKVNCGRMVPIFQTITLANKSTDYHRLLAQGREPYLFREAERSRYVDVAINQDTPENKNRIVR